MTRVELNKLNRSLRGRRKLTSRQVTDIRRIWKENQYHHRQYLLLSKDRLAEKFEVTRPAIEYACSPQCKGTGRFKLDPDDVDLIRRLNDEAEHHRREWKKRSAKVLTDRYGISRATLKALVKYETYKDVWND